MEGEEAPPGPRWRMRDRRAVDYQRLGDEEQILDNEEIDVDEQDMMSDDEGEFGVVEGDEEEVESDDERPADQPPPARPTPAQRAPAEPRLNFLDPASLRARCGVQFSTEPLLSNNQPVSFGAYDYDPDLRA